MEVRIRGVEGPPPRPVAGLKKPPATMAAGGERISVSDGAVYHQTVAALYHQPWLSAVLPKMSSLGENMP